jgi:signal transduction histidine kinase
MSSAERTELTSRLRRSERLATLGQVVAEVAHEIGTPLNVISGRAEEMEHLPGHEPTITANSRSIQDQSRRITRILQRLLDVARERSPSFENLPVASVLESVQDFLTPDFLAGGVRLVLRAPRDLLVRGDFDLLQQVFINLLQNALQASSRGASVEVTATVEGERILVDVQDEGQGVAPEMESRLFEAFASTKAGQGSGLGLPISLSIMRQLGGSLRHVPTPGRKGALFRATLLPAGATARPAEAAWS